MARGLRSSRNKANKSKLRSNVFGPAEIARKQRLSCKLIELASKSQPNSDEAMEMADRENGQRLLLHSYGPQTSLTLWTFSDNAGDP